MAGRYVICPFCGLEFETSDTLCQHGCPMRTLCGLTKCPSCEFEFPEQPKAISWARRLFKRQTPETADSCGHIATVGDLKAGERVKVVSLAGETARRNTLTVFGLTPGSDLTLVQRTPAFVIRVGETELALEAEIARQIVVQREGPTADPAGDSGPDAT